MNGKTIYGKRFSAMRLRIKNDEVETTGGARVSVHQAKLLYRAIVQGLNVVGHKIGYFTVNAIDEDNLLVGCHTIPMSEIHRVGQQLVKSKVAA